jgi:hypothetical protein
MPNWKVLQSRIWLLFLAHSACLSVRGDEEASSNLVRFRQAIFEWIVGVFTRGSYMLLDAILKNWLF